MIETLDFLQNAKAKPVHCLLRREPTEAELSESNNIRTLIWNAKNELHRIDISEESIERYQYNGFDPLLRAHIEHGVDLYSPELAKKLCEDILKNQGSWNTKTCASKHRFMRKTVSMIEEYRIAGALEWRRLPSCALREPCAEFSKLLDEFCTEAIQTGTIKESSLSSFRGAIRSFLFELEDAGIYTFEGISLLTVSERITHLSYRYSGGLSPLLQKIRAFLKHLHYDGSTKLDLSIAIPEFTAVRRPIRPGFSAEETEAMRSEADRAAPLGKRDYAIMTLAAQTGLRACDIAGLKLQDIDWRTNEIRIVQRKTGRALTLPLSVECGNAIADYLLNGRPECSEPYVFLSVKQPFRRMQSGSMGNIAPRYISKANISGSKIAPQGFHGFRRSFGKMLLEAGTPLDMLSELLGHREMDSAMPYIAVDEKGLKFCALNLVPAEKEDGLE